MLRERRLKLAVAAYVVADITKIGMFRRSVSALASGEQPPLEPTTSLLAVEIAGLLAFYRTELDILQKAARVWVAQMPPEPLAMIVVVVVRIVLVMGYTHLLPTTPSTAKVLAQAIVVLSSMSLALYASRYDSLVYGSAAYQGGIDWLNRAIDVDDVSALIRRSNRRLEGGKSAVKAYLERYVRG